MPRTIIDFHVIQTVPPSNINRDDTGSPKTATFGGKRRARISSQAIKKAVRDMFGELVEPSMQGVRTKRVVELVADEVTRLDESVAVERASELVGLALTTAGFKLSKASRSKTDDDAQDEAGYLVFLSRRQVERLAELCVEANRADDPKAALKDGGVKHILKTDNSVDLALFGRMVADSSDLNVDASCQVAHALSVHAVDNEFDYFTAVDDVKRNAADEDAGAAMIGTVEFNSSTLYRYATVDVDALRRNLGDHAAERAAVEAFARAFVTSMPTGKQNTFANRTLPNAVLITVRDSQSVNLVGAFETAITGDGRVRQACEALAKTALEIDEAFGTTPVRSYVIRAGEQTDELDALGAERVNLEAAIEALGACVDERASEAS